MPRKNGIYNYPYTLPKLSLENVSSRVDSIDAALETYESKINSNTSSINLLKSESDNKVVNAKSVIVNDENLSSYDGKSLIHVYNTTKETITDVIDNMKDMIVLNHLAFVNISEKENIDNAREYLERDFPELNLLMINSNNTHEVLYGSVLQNISEYMDTSDFVDIKKNINKQFEINSSGTYTNVFPIQIKNDLNIAYSKCFTLNGNTYMLIYVNRIVLRVSDIDVPNIINVIYALNNCCQIVNTVNQFNGDYDNEYKKKLTETRSNLLKPDIYKGEYLFAYELIGDTELNYTYKTVIHELFPFLESEIVDNMFLPNLDVKLDDVIALAIHIYNSNYPKKENILAPVKYEWVYGLKITFITITIINNKTYLFGSGCDVETYLYNAINASGSVKCRGILDCKDDDKTIFKVDTVNKNILLNAHVGINKKEPTSLIDIEDTTISDYIKFIIDRCYPRHSLLNEVLAKNFTSEGDIIEYIKTEHTETGNYSFSLSELDLNDFTKSKYLYSHSYKEYVGYTFEEIINHARLNNDFETEELFRSRTINISNNIIFDGASFANIENYRYGVSDSLGLFLYINQKFYLFIQHLNSQENIKSLFSNKNWYDMELRWRYVNQYLMILYKNLKYIPEKDVYNNDRSQIVLNETIGSLKYNKPDYSIDFFILKMHKRDKTLSTLEKIDLTNTPYPSDNIYELEMNEKTMYNQLLFEINKSINRFGFNIKDLLVYIVQDNYYDYNVTSVNLDKDDDYYSILISVTNIQSIIPPTFAMHGDFKVNGDIIVSNLDNTKNFCNIDPEEEFVGIGTDERYLNYDGNYVTLTDTLTPRASTIIHSEKYPNLLCERVADDIENPSIFTGSFSSATMKRFSKIYSHKEMYDRAIEHNNQYGVDISFELCDKNKHTQEIGNVGMAIESIDEDIQIKAAFKVSVRDIIQDEAVDVVRDILYVSNDGTLVCNKINLGEKDINLEAQNGKLFYGGVPLALPLPLPKLTLYYTLRTAEGDSFADNLNFTVDEPSKRFRGMTITSLTNHTFVPIDNTSVVFIGYRVPNTNTGNFVRKIYSEQFTITDVDDDEFCAAKVYKDEASEFETTVPSVKYNIVYASGKYQGLTFATIFFDNQGTSFGNGQPFARRIELE